MTLKDGARPKNLRMIILVLLAFVVASVCHAQSNRGELAGSITDSTGAAIAGAKIMAVGIDTGVQNTAISTSAGTYRFPEIAIGRYDVTVSATGFAPVLHKGVLVQINSTTALNTSLKLGAATETITVDASAPGIESESSDVSGTISEQQVKDLPLSMANGVAGLRSAEAFAFLVPGTTGPGTGGGQCNGCLNSNGVFFMKLSGGQSYGAEVMLDGASTQRSENGSSYDETAPSIEAVQEFKVTLSGPSSEFGRSTAGFESFSTKSGANQFHGTAFAFVKNAAFDANDWYNNGWWNYYKCTGNRLTTTNACRSYLRPQDNKFDFGGTLGGPVRLLNPLHPSKPLYNGADKSFFFFAWEQYKLTSTGHATSTVPTMEERDGDFSADLGAPTGAINPCDGTVVYQNTIFDPETSRVVNGVPCRMAFPGNKIPTSRFSGVAKTLMNGLPAPNQTAKLNAPYGYYDNYSSSASMPWTNTTYTVRIDHTLNANHKLFGMYTSRDNTSVHGVKSMPDPFNNNSYAQDFETHYGRGGWDWTITPTLLNHVNIGYNRTNSKNFSDGVGNKTTLTTAGAPNYYSNAFPTVGFGGPDSYSGWGTGFNNQAVDNGLRFNESLTWQKGRHSVKVGLDFRYQQYSIIAVNVPNISFSRNETDYAAVADAQKYSGNTFASYLLGSVDGSSQNVVNVNPRWLSHYIAGFVQDDFKILPTLTLNLGLRYDVDVPRKEAHNRTSNLDLKAPDSAAGGLPGALVFGTNCHGCNSKWADTWMKDVAPRIGFAYLIPHTNGKAVLRGGGAIVYAPLQYQDFGGSQLVGFNQGRGVGSGDASGSTRGYTPAFQLDSGYSPWTRSYFAPNTDPTQAQCPFTGCFWNTGNVIQPKMGRPGMTSQWNLQVQDEMAKDLILTVGYTGSSSQNLHSSFISNINNIDPKYFKFGDHLSENNSSDWVPLGGAKTYTAEDGSSMTVNAPYSTFTGNLGQALSPYPQYGYIADDCCLENQGHSSYEAVTASLNRHFRQGFNLQLAYTYSKNETNADTMIGAYATRDQSQRSDQKGEKAVSVQNVPQQLSLSYLVKLPFGKGQKYLNNNGLLDRVVGGWEISGINRYQTGSPIQLGCASGWSLHYANCFRYTLGAGAHGNVKNIMTREFKHNKNGANYFNGESWFKPAFRPKHTNMSESQDDPGVTLNDAVLVDQNHAGRTGSAAVGYDYWLRKPSADCPDGCSFDPIYFSGASPLVGGGKALPRVLGGVTGPAWLSEDMSLIKNVRLYEKLDFQFKADFTNVLNRHHMSGPNTDPGATTGSNYFGITSGDDMTPRSIQLSGRLTF